VEKFKDSLASFSREEQLDICKQIQPLCVHVTENKAFSGRTNAVREQLLKLVWHLGPSRALFERITNETFVIDFYMELLDLHVNTHIKINFSNLFSVSRSYNGDTEGGGVTDIHISDNSIKVPLFLTPQDDNTITDVNDEGLLLFYTRLVTREHLLFDDSINYEDFRRFVAEAFLRDFDYVQE
jgi:hypothetical protein